MRAQIMRWLPWVVLALILLNMIINAIIIPSSGQVVKFKATAQIASLKAKVTKIKMTGGLGVDRDVYQAALAIDEALSKCEEGPFKCATAHTEFITPQVIKKLKGYKVSSKEVYFIQSLKAKANMWKNYVGEENFETCGSECARAFYARFETSSTPVSVTPFSIAEYLYKNRDLALKLFCANDWDNCPDVKTCAECYELYLKEGDAALKDMINMGCHEACFLVAKRVETTPGIAETFSESIP